jgi:hypothetical protein
VRKSRRLSAKRWTRRYTEPVLEQDPESGEPVADLREVEVLGAAVEDHEAGLVYRLTIEERRGGAAITFLSIETTGPHQQITTEQVPHADLIRHAREVLKARPHLHTREVRLPGVKPPLEQIARDYAEHNRETLANRYEIGKSTLDRWLREARETTNSETGQPYLAKVRPGRPPKTRHTPVGHRSERPTTKENPK